MEKAKIQDPYKIILIGDTGVGKTNIVTRYTKNKFSTTLKPTIGVEFYTKLQNFKTLKNKQKQKTLQIWDTAGQERFRGMAGSYYRRALGVLLVYDITNKKSFENLPKWLKEIKAYTNPKTEISLIGNKCDLVKEREVRREEAIFFCEKFGIVFWEVSALCDRDGGVVEVFEDVARRIEQGGLGSGGGEKGFGVRERKREGEGGFGDGVREKEKRKKSKCC